MDKLEVVSAEKHSEHRSLRESQLQKSYRKKKELKHLIYKEENREKNPTNLQTAINNPVIKQLA